jgi:hypothetical protein
MSPAMCVDSKSRFQITSLVGGCRAYIAHAVVPISLAGLAAQFDISSLFGNGRGRKALHCESPRVPSSSNQRQNDLTCWQVLAGIFWEDYLGLQWSRSVVVPYLSSSHPFRSA